MYTPAKGDRYVLYLPKAKAVFDDIDNSLAETIEGEIRKFFDAFAPAAIFDSSVSPNVDEIKKDRSSVRAFGSYWDGGDAHVLLVVTVYKKKDEDEYWLQASRFEDLAVGYHEQLESHHSSGDLHDALQGLGERDDYRLLQE